MMEYLCLILLTAGAASHDVECAFPGDLGTELPTPRGCGDCLRLGVAAAAAKGLVLLADDGRRDGPPQPGFVATFQTSPTGWQPSEALFAPGAIPGDEFGAALAYDGTHLIVGAPGDGIGGPSGGAAWIFLRTQEGWLAETCLTPLEPLPGGSFGESVALSGDLVAVGASRHDRNGASDVGRVEVFRRHHDAWHRESVIDPSSTTTSLRFGSSLEFSWNGEMLAIGAPGFDQPVDRAGAVFCTTLNREGNWSVASIIQRTRPERLDRFGQRIARTEQYVVTGIPGSDYGAANAGALAILSVKKPFTLLAERIEPTWGGARMGSQIAASPLLLGATMPGVFDSDGGQGRVRLFRVYEEDLVPFLDLIAHNTMPPLGAAIAIDGWRVVVTAIRDEDGLPEPGRAWVLELPKDIQAPRESAQVPLEIP